MLPLSGSLAERVPTVASEAFSATLELESEMSVGPSLTSVTEIVNCFSNVFAPSLTCTRMLYEFFVS